MSFYTEPQRRLQERFDAVPLADRVEAAIVADTVDEANAAFIGSRDFFFLATVDGEGMPTVSYKGGAPGVVSVLDPGTLVFPDYDGNGMFKSMGNIADTAQIGMLFIDLETPNRVRVQATASVSDDDPELARYPGANLLVRASVRQVFHNCGRYIHKHQRVSASPYVPDAAGAAPYPSWKRIDLLQDVLRPGDAGRTEQEGGTITFEDYLGKLGSGTS